MDIWLNGHVHLPNAEYENATVVKNGTLFINTISIDKWTKLGPDCQWPDGGCLSAIQSRLFTFDVGSKNVTVWTRDHKEGEWATQVDPDGNIVYSFQFEMAHPFYITTRPVAYIEDGYPSPNPALDTDTIEFRGWGTDDNEVVLCEWISDINGTLHKGLDGNFSTDDLMSGHHNLTFRVKDNHGFWSENVTTYLNVTGRPIAFIDSITLNPALAGENITFEGHGVDDGTIEKYLWFSSINGELYHGTIANLTLSTLSNGIHKITFKVMDNEGFWSEDTKAYLNITTRPVAYIEDGYPSPNPALDTDTIEFRGWGTDDNEVVLCEWISDINGTLHKGLDGNFSTDDLMSGHHNLTFRVKDNHGFWSENVTTYLNVTGRPTAFIEIISPNPGLDTDDIHFKGNGIDDGTIEKYTWRTDNIGLYNGTDSKFLYSSFTPGTYRIFLKVQDNNGVWSEEVNTTVLIHERPIAIIDSISPNPGLDTDTIHFKGIGTDDGSIVRYAWRSDGGELYNGTDSEFLYSAFTPETHSIYLKVQDDYGVWSEEVNTTLTIHEQPTAIIDLITPNPGIDNETINFNGNGTDDGIIERYTWKTDDGELYNGTDSEFSYSAFSRGDYTIYLKVQDNHGVWSEEVNVTLIIHESPVAEIVSISPSPGTEGDTITFTGNGTDDGSIIQYFWRTDELELYNGTNSSFSLSNLSAGTHTIYLRVQDNYGVWSDEVNKTLVIHAIIIPNTIPTVTITSPKDRDTVKGKVPLNGTSADEDGTVVKVEISINEDVWTTVTGTDSWTFEWNTAALTNGNYTIRVRSYDGTNFSETVSITVTVENQIDDGKDDDDPEDNFLFEEIGPLPLIGYIGIVIVIGIVLIAGGKRGNGNSEGGTTPSTILSPTPPPGPSASSTQPPQQPPPPQPLPPPIQPPQQLPFQQSVPSQGPQPDAQTPSGVPSETSMQPEGTWICPRCGSNVESKFIFCMNCGSQGKK